MKNYPNSGNKNSSAEISPRLSDDKLKYIEESGLMFEKLGMTRMSGRVFGYLIISDMDAASFDQIREAVSASKGSISNTLKQLDHIGFVEATSFPGDRKTYFRPTKVPIATLLNARNHQTQLFSDSMNKARSLKQRDDEVSDWLLEVSCFYDWIGQRLVNLLDEWETMKVGYMKKRKKVDDETSKNNNDR